MRKRTIAILCTLALILGMIPAAAPAAAAVDTQSYSSTSYMAGYAAVNITPSESVPLAGYGNTLTRLSTGVLKDLYATCIAVTDTKGETVLLISLDVIGAVEQMVNDIRTAIAARGLDIPAANVIVNVSHTHSGPDISGCLGKSYTTDTYTQEQVDAVAYLNEWYKTVLIPGVADAVEQAYGNRSEATLSRKSLEIDGMNFVRLYEDKDGIVGGDNAANYGSFKKHAYDADKTMQVLKFDCAEEDILLVSWRAHPKMDSTAVTTYGGTTHRRHLSSDYVGYFRDALEAGTDCKVSFIQGAAGNINTFSDIAASSSFSNAKNQTGENYGKKLAGYAQTAVNSTEDWQSISAGVIETRQYYYETIANTTWAERGYLINEHKVSDAKAKFTSLYPYVTGSGLSTRYYYSSSSYNNLTAAQKEETVYQFLNNYFTNVSGYRTVYAISVAKELCRIYGINSSFHLSRANGQKAFWDSVNNKVIDNPTVRQFELNALTFSGSLAMITAPFEIFDSNYDEAAMAAMGLNSVYGQPFVLGYTNGSNSYLPDYRAFGYGQGNIKSANYAVAGSYEANQCTLEVGEGELVAQKLVDMLNDLAKVQTAPTTKTAYCNICNETVTWVRLTAEMAATETMAHDHCYLAENVSSAKRLIIPAGQTVCLDLGAYTLDCASALDGSTMYVVGTLNLVGSAGVVKGYGAKGGRSGGVVVVGATGVLNQYSGTTIQRAEKTDYTALSGGAVHIVTAGVGQSRGVYNMYGGTVTGGRSTLSGGNIYNGGILTVYPGSTITTGTAQTSGGNISNEGSLVIKGGKIEHGSATTGTGGNIHIHSASTVQLLGGTISEGHTSATGNGGNIFINADCTLLMGAAADTDDAEPMITNGVSERNGGNIWNNDGRFVMYSGTITAGSGGNGANIGSYGTTELYGGTIHSPKKGTDIRVVAPATMLIGGDAKVDGTVSVQYNSGSNTVGLLTLADKAEVKNISLEKVTTDAGANFQVQKGYSGKAKITLPAYSQGVVFGSVTGAVGEGQQLTLSNSSYRIGVRDGKLIATRTNNLCPKCGLDVVWYNLDGTVYNLTHDHYRVPGTVNTTYQVNVTGDVCLDTNGQTYTANSTTTAGSTIAVKNGATLKIFGNGTLQRSGYSGSNEYSGGVIRIESGNVELWDATLKQPETKSSVKYGGVVSVAADSKFHMHSGLITGGNSVNNGGNVYSYGTFIMGDAGSDSQPIIDGGYSGRYCGNVWIQSGEFIMYNGIIRNGTANTSFHDLVVASGAVATLHGGVVSNTVSNSVSNVQINAGGKMTITGNAQLLGGRLSLQTTSKLILDENGYCDKIFFSTDTWDVESLEILETYTGTKDILLAMKTPSVGQIGLAPGADSYFTVLKCQNSGYDVIARNEKLELMAAGTLLDISAELNEDAKKYTVGDTFDPEDLTVNAIYSDGSTAAVKNFTTNMTGAFETAGQNQITVTYAENSISATDIVTVEVQGTSVCEVVLNGTQTQYSSIKEALANYDINDGGYIRLIDHVGGTAQITEDIYVDMNGCSMSVSIASGVNLYGMESATNDFDLGENESCGILTVVDGAIAADAAYGSNRYLALPGESGTYTFHAFVLNTEKGLRPYNENNGTGLYFQPYFQADQEVAAAINNGTIDYGVLMTMDKTADGGAKIPVYQTFGAYTFETGSDNSALRVVLYGMMPNNKQLTAHEGYDTEAAYLAKYDISKYPVTGQACFKIGDAYVTDDADQTISLREAIYKVDKLYPSMSDTSAQKIGLDNMWKHYSKVISSWSDGADGSVDEGLLNIGNIKIDISDWFQ